MISLAGSTTISTSPLTRLSAPVIRTFPAMTLEMPRLGNNFVVR